MRRRPSKQKILSTRSTFDRLAASPLENDMISAFDHMEIESLSDEALDAVTGTEAYDIGTVSYEIEIEA